MTAEPIKNHLHRFTDAVEFVSIGQMIDSAEAAREFNVAVLEAIITLFQICIVQQELIDDLTRGTK